MTRAGDGEKCGTLISLRAMERADLGFGMRLKDAAGWNQREADWEHFLRERPEGAFVALLDDASGARGGDRVEGIPAGTVTTLDYGGVGWIGMLLVDERSRRRGVGTRLLEGAIASLAGCECIRLDATAAGRAVYEPRGFVAEHELARLRRDPARAGAAAKSPSSTGGVRSAGAADLAGLVELDARAFGRPRPALIGSWLERAPRCAFARGAQSGIEGFVLGRDGSRADHIGPIVAADVDVAAELLEAALACAGERPVIIDALLADRRWVERLRALGFVEERRFTRMRLGPARVDLDPARYRAAAGPEVG